MKPVQLLPPEISEKIAAGEVIERPSSVVKELVENSLDAGAKEVAVILEDGGKGLIEILDNGCGMTRQDLSLAVQRHATSKINSLDDLEKIRTLGFRGEALPSIAAVTELTIVSRTADQENAYELNRLTPPQPITFGHFLGSSHGTQIRAKSLFSQVPARLKFLKSSAAELAHIREWLEKLAIARPDTGFKLVSDDRTVLSLRPTSEENRIREIIGDGEDTPILTHESAAGKIRARLYWLQGLSVPQTRKIVQVVNGRVVRDRLVQQALLNPFRQSFLPGRFPAAAIFIDIDPDQLDVNVHPTKTEVRFLENRDLFVVGEKLVQAVLEKARKPTASEAFETPVISFTASVRRPPDSAAPYRTVTFQAAEQLEILSQVSSTPERPVHPFSYGKYVGIFFRTYIAYDLGEEIGLVDQHAAHERIRYEKLKQTVLTEGPPPSQDLLLPEAVSFPETDRRIIESRLHLLETLGFTTEIFGEDTLLFRAIPTAWGTSDLRTRLKNLVSRLLEIGDRTELAMDENLFEKLASEACHSAVRAGDDLGNWEAQALIEDLFLCEHPWNCPHGRPTVVKIPRGKFEEWFERRV